MYIRSTGFRLYFQTTSINLNFYNTSVIVYVCRAAVLCALLSFQYMPYMPIYSNNKLLNNAKKKRNEKYRGKEKESKNNVETLL